MKLEQKMNIIHNNIQKIGSIKGSILLKENGLHVSSHGFSDKRRLAANIAKLCKYFRRMNNCSEINVQLNDGSIFYIKHLPSSKLILTTIFTGNFTKNINNIMNSFSQEFKNLLE